MTIDMRAWKGLGNVVDLKGSGEHPFRSQMHDGAGEQTGGVKLVDIKDIAAFHHSDPNGVAVIMPCIDVEKGRATAEMLVRAEMPCLVLVVNDSIRQGFIKTLNAAAARLTVRYVVYLAEDAFPGRGWLRRAYQALEDSGKGLLGFNDGKWDGRIASFFGMVRTSWARQLYGGDVLNAEYRAHKADNEITVIARAADEYEYRSDCTLVEVDPRKDVRGSNQGDDEMFRKRMLQGFGGIIARSDARALAKTYKVKWLGACKNPSDCVAC